MDLFTLAMIMRGLGMVFTQQGKPEMGRAWVAGAVAIEAGRVVDAQMKELATLMKAGGHPPEWDDLATRIEAHTAQFLS